MFQDGFYLLAKGGLGLQVFHLLLLEPLKMGLVLLVDDRSGGPETLPDGIPVFLGHRAQFLPLFMEFLEFLEGIHHILALGEGLSLLAVGGLGFQVLLEVQVAEFPVDLDQVVEFLHIHLVRVVHVPVVLLRDRSNLAPAVLDFPELGESVLHVHFVADEGLQVLNHRQFLLEVFLAFGIQFLIIFGTCFLIFIVQGLETGLDGCERTFGNGLLRHRLLPFFHGIGRRFHHRRILTGLCLFLGQALVERRFDGFRLLGALHAVHTFGKGLEQFRQFGQGFLAEIHHHFLHVLHDVFHVFSDFFYLFGDRRLLLHFYIWGLGLDGLRLDFFTHDCFALKI